MSTKLLRYILGIICLTQVISIKSQEKGELRVAHKLVGGHLAIYDIKDNTELVTSSAGAGRDSKKKKNEDEKKTLSQQVADGKYGLIQTELFSKPIKRPGIISYKDNNEVPNDNIKNLGGLNKNDIWLSENHLLVIRGGTYPPHTERPSINTSTVWPPIDDYRAPQRQVKIPKHPKVPPPFPVQLTENGPLLLLGTNASTTLNGTFGSQLYPLYPPENYISEDGDQQQHSYPPNVTSGETPFSIPPYAPNSLGEYNSTDGFPQPLNDTVPPLFSFFGPGALLPPPDNITNLYDEDDTSIYYPPPYSFYYQKDNTSKVPAGPLVPGIVLPPPPDFFAPVEEEITTIRISKPIVKSEARNATTETPNIDFNQINNAIERKINFTRTTPSSITRKPYIIEQAPKKTYPSVTILKPVTTTSPNYNDDTLQNPFRTYSPPNNKNHAVVNTTQVPYYTSTYKTTPVAVAQKPNRTYLPSGVFNTQFVKTTTKPPAQYYLYEENDVNTTPKQKQLPQYYNNPRDSSIPVQQIYPQRTFSDGQNTQYYFINGENIFENYQTRPPIRTTQKPDTFSIHIARLKDQIHSHHIIQPNKNYYRSQVPSSKPVYQYSFQAANYPSQRNTYQNPLQHYQVQIEEAIEVTTPVYETSQENFYYQSPVTQNPIKYRKQQDTEGKFNYGIPKTISQFSFEVTPNPIYQQFYTKHDEKYIDDVTKQHFTVFGKKLPPITTPIPPSELSEYIQPNPVELQQDTIINYLRPQRPTNPHAEYVDSKYYNVDYRPAQPVYNNYVPQQRPMQNANGNLRFSEPQYANEERKSYVTYKLPGDRGTHFYFITPQLAQKREQNASFYFSRSNTSSLRDNENVRYK